MNSMFEALGGRRLGIALTVLAVLAFLGFSSGRPSAVAQTPESEAARVTLTQPDPASETTKEAPPQTAEERAAMLAARDALRDSVLPKPAVSTAKAEANNLGATAAPGSAVAPQNEILGVANNARLTLRNIRNTLADNPGGSTLAEPAAINEGPNVLFMGNTHQEFSTNNGLNYTNIPIPGGPADAPFVCCDPDVIYDAARGISFRIWLFTNAATTNGVVRIYVRRDQSLADNCSYTIDPAGGLNNTLPDYPHLGLTNDFLYLTTNNIGGANGGRSQVRRFNIDQMSDCVGTATNLYQYIWGAIGQRVFVPANGTREIMYWSLHEDVDTLRIFAWPETAAGPSTYLRNIAASSFPADVDCRGGTGDQDWWRAGTPSSIAGFRTRSAIGMGRLHIYWNSGAIGGATQGHIRGAIFSVNESAPGVLPVIGAAPIAQPVIFNNSFCWGYPIVGANDRGDMGMVLAYGGRAGGLAGCVPNSTTGCAAAQSAYAIDDDYSAGVGFGPATPFGLYATGTHNMGRFGDYFTIKRHAPCGLVWVATGYGLSGGIAVANANVRYLEFGRGRDHQCWLRWQDEDPIP
jgi:hypothetical protein